MMTLTTAAVENNHNGDEHGRVSSEDMSLTAAGLEFGEVDEYLHSLLLPRRMAFDEEEHTKKWRVWVVVVALLQAATLYVAKGQTPGMRALGITPTSSQQSSSSPSSKTISRFLLLKWISFAILLPTAYRYLQEWYREESAIPLPSTEENDEIISRVARERQRRIVKSLMDIVEKIMPVARLYTLLSWWAGGGGAAPHVAMTLAGISIVTNKSSSPHHRLFVSFAHRRWLYQELVRTLQLVSPVSSWNELISLYSE